MHSALFETGWDSTSLMSCHRREVSRRYCDRGRSVLVLDWTYGHHRRGPHIHGTKKSYDHVEQSYNYHQTLLTATVSNRDRVDGLDVVVQTPSYEKEEFSYLSATRQDRYDSTASLHQRLLETERSIWDGTGPCDHPS